MQMLGAIVLLGLVWQSHAFFNNQILYPFPRDSFLTCYIPNPFRGQPGEPYTIAEPIPRVSLGQARFNETWLPLESGFRVPNFGTVTKQEQLDFLGDCLNPNVVAVQLPTDVPPTIEQLVGLIPLSVGSGGLQSFLVLPPPYNCSAVFERYPFDFINDEARTDAETFLCTAAGINVGNCPVEVTWEELPSSYFPRFYAAGRCERDDQCSIPAGEYCFPRVGDGFLLYTTVLRWDCCFSFGPSTPLAIPEPRDRRGLPNRANQLRWECGWRKVQIPIVTSCFCRCPERSPVFG